MQLKSPKIELVNWVEDLTSSPKKSKLRALANGEKQGKIKVWQISSSQYAPQFVIVIYDET